MSYDGAMDARRTNPPPSPPSQPVEWVEEPLTADDIAACEEAEAQIARGEWVDGAVAMAELDAMIARHRARARRS
ncbi:MAG: hypothetical protein WCO11_03675 [Sphingomonadales bacterium]|jgi:hypothetical protein